MWLYAARKTIFSFSGSPEKIVFPKKLRLNMIFLVSSGKVIFLFPKNMILPLGRKMKDDLSKKTHGNMIFSSGVLKRWSFQKGHAGTWPFLYYLERWYLFSRKHDSFSLDEKWKLIFLKKYTEAGYFLCTRAGVTNVVLGPFVKKIKDDLLPQKYA